VANQTPDAAIVAAENRRSWGRPTPRCARKPKPRNRAAWFVRFLDGAILAAVEKFKKPRSCATSSPLAPARSEPKAKCEHRHSKKCEGKLPLA
jgi:hypothetical protein